MSQSLRYETHRRVSNILMTDIYRLLKTHGLITSVRMQASWIGETVPTE